MFSYLSRMYYANLASFLYHLHHVIPAVEAAPEQEREFLLHLHQQSVKRLSLSYTLKRSDFRLGLPEVLKCLGHGLEKKLKLRFTHITVERTYLQPLHSLI